MPRVTIRFDDAQYERLARGAEGASSNVAAYIRDVLDRFEGIDDAGYHGRFDELHATSIQIHAIVTAALGAVRPDLLDKGMDDARELLRKRGLLDPEQDDR